MTDTTLNRFLSRGTAAARVLFTPSVPTPASGPSNGYLWFEEDTGRLYAWNTSFSPADWDLVDVLTSNDKAGGIQFQIDGGGVAITTGMKGYVEVPFACTITRGTLLADQSGSIVVDLFKCTYAQFDAGSTHPVSGDKITASAPLTISGATKSQDSTLTGWTTSLAAGDILGWNVNSAATIQRATGSLLVAKT